MDMREPLSSQIFDEVSWKKVRGHGELSSVSPEVRACSGQLATTFWLMAR